MLAAAQSIYHQSVGLMMGKNMEGSDCGPVTLINLAFLWTERKA